MIFGIRLCIIQSNKSMSKNVDNSENLNYYGINERMFVVLITKGELSKMTENEKELIKIIRENGNLEQALMTATAIILDFLKQHESSEEQAVVCLQELG